MATEARRACGFRKVGGLYLRAPGSGLACDRLPVALTICPCCSAGFKQSRGWTWLDVELLLGGVHSDCKDEFPCPLCMDTGALKRAGLLWVGEKFYPTPADFIREAESLGISKRIATIPRGFKIGETWVLLAHPKAAVCFNCHGGGLSAFTEVCDVCHGKGKLKGIFRVFRPAAVEMIVTASSAADGAFMADLAGRGITPVVVPDDDKDHAATEDETEG